MRRSFMHYHIQYLPVLPLDLPSMVLIVSSLTLSGPL